MEAKVVAPSRIEDLRQHCEGARVVEVQDADGSRWAFEIARIPILTWDADGSWLAVMRDKGVPAFAEIIGKAMSAPTPEIMRRALVRSIRSPRVSERGGPDSLSVDAILARDVLAIRLYGAIAELASEGLMSVREMADQASQRESEAVAAVSAAAVPPVASAPATAKAPVQPEDHGQSGTGSRRP